MGWVLQMGSPDTSRGALTRHPPDGRAAEGVLSSAAGSARPLRHDPDPSLEAPRTDGQACTRHHPTRPARPAAALDRRRPARRSRCRRWRAPSPPRPDTLTDEEAARAAEIEARLVAAERSAEEAARRQIGGRRRAVAETPVRAGSIAVRAAQEYAYVARDVRRIALIGGSMIALLIAIWIVTQVTGIGI